MTFKMEGLNVLSLFDGMSCWMVALERAGIPVKNYFASEIDKYAIAVSKKNYPNIIRLWDVMEVRYYDGTLSSNYVSQSNWKMDLLIGGSPCQGFSFAGKQLNFEDPRSKLFFEYVRITKETNPKYFLLENVFMKEEYQDIISEALGVKPILINSSLVSWQIRKRLYWTNIEWVTQPIDRGITIQDILEDKWLPVIKRNWKYTIREDKSTCIDANYWRGPDNHWQRTFVLNCDELWHANLNWHDFLKRVYSINWKCPTLTAVCWWNQERKIAINKEDRRKLTPLECERLQTLPDNFSEGVSNSQRYKMIWNGWTVDVIAHILSFIK